MLPNVPGVGWRTLASNQSHLPTDIRPWFCLLYSRRGSSFLNQFSTSRWHYISYHRPSRPHAIIHLSQHWRGNSSLAAAKAALRNSRSPQRSGSQSNSGRVNRGGNSAVPASRSPLAETARSPKDLELEYHIFKSNKLKADYYEAVDKDSDVLWLTWEEVRGVPASLATRWITRPRESMNERRYGLSRLNVHVDHVAAFVADPDVRKKLIMWHQDTCKDLAESFKEMVLSRAAVARLSGYESYFDYMSQFKMMGTRSVKGFLKDLKSQVDPHLNALMKSVFEQKFRDLYDKPTKEVHHALKHYGKTIQDFQLSHKDTQINWGDLRYYNNLNFRNASDPERSKIHEYFPLDHTIDKLLLIFGDLFGMNFTELSPGHKQYQVAVLPYLASAEVTEREAKLRVFLVTDKMGIIPRPLGFLVLDSIERDGKARQAFSQTFQNFRFEDFHKEVPGVAIVNSFSRPTSKKPTLLMHSHLEELTHELGHAIQTLVRGTLADVPRDFVEIPSIMLENWVFLPSILRKISCHYTYLNPDYLTAWKSASSPTESLPLQPPQEASLEMFRDIVYRRHPKNEIVNLQDLLWKSMFDFVIHSSPEEDLKSMDIGLKCSQILYEWTGIWTPPNGNGQNNTYLHWWMLKNYDTSAYCYLVAKVYSIDLWNTHFAKNPLNKSMGRRYRRLILEHRDVSKPADPLKNLISFILCKIIGRPRTSMEALTKYLGRKPNSKAFAKALKAPASKNQTFWRRVAVRMGWGQS